MLKILCVIHGQALRLRNRLTEQIKSQMITQMLFKKAPADIAQVVLIFFGSLLIYSTVSTYQLVGDARPNELLPISIIREGNLDFDEFALINGQMPYYLKEINGRRVSAYSPVPGFLNVPAYFVAKILGEDIKGRRFILSHWTTCILCSLSAVFMWGVLKRLDISNTAALFSIFTYCFATPVWSSASVSLWQHSSSLFLLNAAVCLLLVAQSGQRQIGGATTLAGFLLGIAFWCRPTNLLFLLGCTLYTLLQCALHHRWRRICHLFAGLLLAAIPYCWYSVKYLGSVLAARNASIHGVNGFSGEWLSGAAGLLYSPSRGLFIFSPILLLSLLCLPNLMRQPLEKRNLAIAISASAVSLFAATSKWSYWWGGASYGPRLLCEIIPALTILLALSWDRIRKHPTLTVLSLVLLSWSVYVHFLGALYYPCGFNSIPVIIDRSPDRLWDIRRSQIEYCIRKSLDARS